MSQPKVYYQPPTQADAVQIAESLSIFGLTNPTSSEVWEHTRGVFTRYEAMTVKEFQALEAQVRTLLLPVNPINPNMTWSCE